MRSPNTRREMIPEEENKKTSRDTEEGDDTSSCREFNHAEVSPIAEALASLALKSTDDDAGTEINEKGMLDPELLKPHLPNEDCPVCFVPLPFSPEECTYVDCCGKLICSACSKEHIRANHIRNIKRRAKELPELENTCPFCRELQILKSDSETIDKLEKRTLKGDEVAVFDLAREYMKGGLGLDQDEGKAIELFHRAADMGSVSANMWLSHAYAFEEDLVELDKAKMYTERAVKLNYPQARGLLASFAAQGKHNPPHLAIQHCMLGAAAGVKEMMDLLWTMFYKGKISKEDLEDTLRKYHQSCENMNSEARERHAAWKKAQDENNTILRDIHTSYYQGRINAKQLKIITAVLKGELDHRDFGRVMS